MSLMHWKKSPAAQTSLSGFQQEMNRLFNSFFSDFGAFEGQAPFPAVSVSDNDKLVTVTAELPGVEAHDIEVSADGNVLTIRGEKKTEKKEELDSWYRVERSYGSFMRRVELPSAVDTGHAEASLDKGVLTLKLPKAAAEKARTIKVHAK